MQVVGLFKVCLNGTYSNVRMSKHLPYELPVQNGLKQGDAVSPPCQFCFRYAVGKVLENQERVKSNWTRSAVTFIRWVKTYSYTIRREGERSFVSN